MTPISLDRTICRNLDETTTREWLITNGIGAYASGTVAGMLTRMEHGLLVTCTPETSVPQLLVAKIDEEVVFDQRTYYLGTNEYRDGTLNPSGFVHLETFRLEEGFPVFTYRLGGIDGIMLEKRIWMQQGRNTSYIQYRLVCTTKEEASGRRRSGITGALSNITSSPADEPQLLRFTLLPLVAYRPYNGPQYGNHERLLSVKQLRQQGQQEQATSPFEEDFEQFEEYVPMLPEGVAGCRIHADDGALPYHLLAVGQPESEVMFLPTNVWYWNFLRRRDAAMERPALDDLYLPGVIRATLRSDDDASLTIIASTEELTSHPFTPEQLNRAYQRSVEGQRQFLSTAFHSQRYFGDGGEAVRVHSFAPFSSSSQTGTAQPAGDETYLCYLLRATERFLSYQQLPQWEAVQRVPGNHYALLASPERSFVVLSDYYGLQRRTRDTLIALPGLLLTGNHTREVAATLREIARHFRHGLLPSMLPFPIGQEVQESEYRSIDLPLWYCYALDAYLRTRSDDVLLEEVYPLLMQSISSYVRGTLHGIHVDADDGLLTSTDALTWMEAIHDNTPVTPRSGKAVEVNALWYSALSLMSEWSQQLYRAGRINYHNAPTISYRDLLSRCRKSFNRRFWHTTKEEESQESGESMGYLFDVVDGPYGDDDALRPNQLFALSLRHSVLTEERRAAVLDSVTRDLLTPYGLRTLSPRDAHYRGYLGARGKEQAQAVHQGAVWTWLLGPYIDAALNVGYMLPLQGKQTAPLEHGRERKYDNDRCHDYLLRRGLHLFHLQQETMTKELLGMCGSVFDGDAPYTSGYPLASLISTTELLRVYHRLQTARSSVAVVHQVGGRV